MALVLDYESSAEQLRLLESKSFRLTRYVLPENGQCGDFENILLL